MSASKEVAKAGSLRPSAVVKRCFKWLWKHRKKVIGLILWLYMVIQKFTADD